MFFVSDIEKDTLENENYRKVIWTTEYKGMQLVLMSIPVGQDIELEIHKEADQFIRIEKGDGELHIGKHEEVSVPIKDGSALIIERNTYHRIVNVGSIPLKLYTVYTPAQHSKNKVERFRPPSESKKENEEVKNRKDRKMKRNNKKALHLLYLF